MGVDEKALSNSLSEELIDKTENEIRVLTDTLREYIHSQHLSIRVIKESLRRIYSDIDSYHDGLMYY